MTVPAPQPVPSQHVPARVTWRLGWRFLRVADRRRPVSLLLVVVGLAVSVLSVLSGVAAFTTVHERTARSTARAFQVTPAGGSPAGWVDIHSMPLASTSVLRIDIAVDGASAPRAAVGLPPGLVHWPALGTEIVSPAFARRAVTESSARSATLRAYAPGDITGQVGQAGLLAPDELLVYRGVTRSSLPGGGLGISPRLYSSQANLFLPSLEMPATQVAGLVVVFSTCVGLPLIAFLGVAARLSAATRVRRLAALRLLGVPDAVVSRVNGVEVAVLAGAGTVLALCLYPLTNRLLAGSGLLGVSWFASDTAVTTAQAELVLVATSVIAGLVAARTGRGAAAATAGSSSVHTRRPAPARAMSRWRLLPLVIATASLTGQVIAGARRPAGSLGMVHLDLLMSAAVLLTAVGLMLGLTPLVALVGTVVRGHARSLPARLGGARAAFDPSTTARLVAGMAVLVFALGVTIGQTRDARAVSTPVGPTVDISVDPASVPASMMPKLLNLPGAPAVLQVTSDPSDASMPSVTADLLDCRSLVSLLTGSRLPTVPDCEPGASYWSPSSTLDHADLSRLHLPPAVAGPGRSGLLPVPVADSLMPADVVLTMDADALGEIASTATRNEGPPIFTVVLRARQNAVNATLAAIYIAAPYSQPSAMGLDPDSGRNIAMINGYLRLGLLAGALLAFLSVVTALADRVGERRRADHELLASGAAPALVRAAHRWEVGIGLGVGLSIATVTGTLGGLAWQYAGGLVHDPDWDAIVSLTLAAAAAWVAAVAAAAAFAPRRLDPAALRST